MEAAMVIAVYYYDGCFYLPTCVRSLSGMVGSAGPISIIPEDDPGALAEAIELRAIAGNATVSNAEFRATSDTVIIAAMHLPNRQAFYSRTRRWSIVEQDGAYTLIPFTAASIRGVVEDAAHAVPLRPGSFAAEAADHLLTQARG